VRESNALVPASHTGDFPPVSPRASCTAKESNLAARPYQNRLRTHAAVRSKLVRDLRIELSFTGS
jgi:hypothetical protein